MRVFILLFVLLTSVAHANLRERVKQRFFERAQSKEAPAAEAPPEKITKAGDYTFTIGERFYKVHVPAKLKSPAPLLIVLHGGGGDMTIQSTEEFYHQISSSDQRGYVAVFPNGISAFKSGKLATWNAGRCCGKARDSKSDDVSFIRDIIRKTSSQLAIDSKRIFATGMSNGGMMSYRLACELSGTIRAIASVAGTDNTTECKPTHLVSVLHIHAKDDDHVLFNGGAGKDAFRDLSQVTNFTSVPKTIEKWRALEKCSTPAKRILETKGAYCERSFCEEAQVQLCVTDTGGHSWPGGKKPSPIAKGTPTKAIIANDVIWDFFDSL